MSPAATSPKPMHLQRSTSHSLSPAFLTAMQCCCTTNSTAACWSRILDSIIKGFGSYKFTGGVTELEPLMVGLDRVTQDPVLLRQLVSLCLLPPAVTPYQPNPAANCHAWFQKAFLLHQHCQLAWLSVVCCEMCRPTPLLKKSSPCPLLARRIRTSCLQPCSIISIVLNASLLMYLGSAVVNDLLLPVQAHMLAQEVLSLPPAGTPHQLMSPAAYSHAQKSILAPLLNLSSAANALLVLQALHKQAFFGAGAAGD